MNKNISRLIKLGFLIIVLIVYLYSKEKIFPLLFPKKIIQPFKNLTVSTVDQLSITFENKTIEIIKKNNQWLTNGYKADNERINLIFENISKIIQDDIVSLNKKKHAELGIIENKITFKSKNVKNVLYIGNSATIDKNYIRVNNNNEVFLASGFTDIFSPFDYRNLKVHLIDDENKVTTININNLKLEKKKDKWFIGEKEIKKESVDFYLSDLKTLKATDILSQEVTLSYPELTIKIPNKELNFYPISDDQENHYLKTTNSPLIYKISSASFTTLKKEEKDFIE